MGNMTQELICVYLTISHNVIDLIVVVKKAV
ncbi:hypothetical protein SAMN05421818_10439 [Myroides phaeus]|uniref:Uncharacterized protein n=1 Tax=Myroides phaeus TaxID=702745 RepID=A0A1G8CGD8_9FLAO|nr:hypothetical protein SAMN05421818_10439 [Myroides phaeus]